MGVGLGTARAGWQWGVALGTLWRCSLSVRCASGRHEGHAVCGEPEINLPPWVWLSKVDDEGLMQLSVPAELAQKVLQVLEKRCQGSSLRDLRVSRVYARHFLGRGAEQDGGGNPALSSEGDGCGSTGPEGTMAKAAEGDLCVAPGPPQAHGVAVKSDSQLFSELLEREGLFLPEMMEEQSQGNVLPHTGAQARCWQQHCCLQRGGLWARYGGLAGRGCLKWGCPWVLGL